MDRELKNQWIVENSIETVKDLIEIGWNPTKDVEAEKSIEGVEDSIKIVDDSMEIVAESNKKVVHDLTWMYMADCWFDLNKFPKEGEKLLTTKNFFFSPFKRDKKGEVYDT